MVVPESLFSKDEIIRTIITLVKPVYTPFRWGQAPTDATTHKAATEPILAIWALLYQSIINSLAVDVPQDHQGNVQFPEGSSLAGPLAQGTVNLSQGDRVQPATVQSPGQNRAWPFLLTNSIESLPVSRVKSVDVPIDKFSQGRGSFPDGGLPLITLDLQLSLLSSSHRNTFGHERDASNLRVTLAWECDFQPDVIRTSRLSEAPNFTLATIKDRSKLLRAVF